jgi:hypothetical protein
MQQLGLVALVKIELPDGDVRLCEGGAFTYASESYRDVDPLWGAIGEVSSMGEGIGNEVPALQLTLLPPSGTEPGDIHQAGMQKSPSWWWIAEYDVATGAIVGDADLQFYGQVDQCTLEIDPAGEGDDSGERRVVMSHVSSAEVLFEGNTGNGLNSTFHQAIFPGELGHDEATGLARPEAWGAVPPSPGGSVARVAVPRNYAEERL